MASESVLPAVADIVALAVSLHQSGHVVEAEELYQRALERSPSDMDALHFLGVLRHQQGDSIEAIRLIRSALQGNPRYLSARLNLGNVLKETERFSEAEKEYRSLVSADDRHPEAWNNLGAVLRAQRKVDAAIEAFQRAIELRPDYADAFQNLGNAYRSAGRLEEALTAFRRAVEINPRQSRAHLGLGRALHAFGRTAEAAVVYRQWLKLEPQNPIAAHMLAACGGSATPVRCSDDFVKESFDAFAASFDEVLDRLDYRAPEMIEDALADCGIDPTPNRHVLDAGCGTGLCGPALRRYSETLIGIDLSPKMMIKARARGTYDRLIETELVDHLWKHPGQYDIIVSADTMVYFGALDQVFRATAQSLCPGGIFAFTVEHLVESGDDPSESAGHRLNPHGRYSHSESYVQQCLSDAGLQRITIERGVLRLESKTPVEGLVVTARKLS